MTTIVKSDSRDHFLCRGKEADVGDQRALTHGVALIRSSRKKFSGSERKIAETMKGFHLGRNTLISFKL